MTRLDKVIKAFNDYDKLVLELTAWLNEPEAIVAEARLKELREEVSPLVGELNRHGCRRKN